jgi:hypothetical protein
VGNLTCAILTLYREAITISVFILAGQILRAMVQFDGPLPAEGTIDSGMALRDAINIWDASKKHSAEHISISEVVDFEHLNVGPQEIEEFKEQADFGAKEDETLEERRERRAQQRKKALEDRERRDDKKRKQRSKVREEGEPIQKTYKAPAAGWYRFCVAGTWFQVTAEIDIRKESEFGGLDDQGHVWTMQEKTLDEEEKLMEEDTAASEGIKDEDFESTKEKLKTLRRLLAEIQSKQSQERHRLIVHAATNEHSHSRMVLSSLMETILFMAVTGFQVYTIRRWFKGAPQLGR